MSPRANALVVALACAAGCSRRPAPTAAADRAAASPRRTQTPAPTAAREVERERGRGPLGESPAEEIMERVRDLSPYANDEAGLAQLARDAVQAATANDRARLETVLGPAVPTRDVVRMGLTFDGDRQLGAYLTAPSITTRDQLVARAAGWARMTDVAVTSATGAEIAQGGAAFARVSPEMGRLAAMLRPMVRWYRVTLAEPGTQNRAVLESFVYVGGRWQFVPEPWRFAPGEAARGTTAPSPPFADRLRALPNAR